MLENQISTVRLRWTRRTVGGLFIAGTMVLGARLISPVQADVERSPTPDAFKSGGARSEIVLREIADTLKRMDGRLERIEALARKGAGPEPAVLREGSR